MSTNAARMDGHRTLMAAILASVAMLFTAFIASYMERRGSAAEWNRIAMPDLVWIGTGILVLSSVTAELARRRGGSTWAKLTILFGLGFLGCQVGAWATLRERGVFLPSNPHASFFYMLTALHGLHLLGGLAALGASIAKPAIRGLCTGFWHFMGAVWIYVLAILTVL